MSEQRHYLYPIVAVAATAALGWWLVSEPDSPSDQGRSADGKRSPQYYATDATLHSYTAGGALNARINGQRFDYFSAEDHWQLTEPRWRRLAHGDSGRPWQGRARRGRLSDDETRGRLRGDVVLKTPGKHGPIRVYTDRLRLYLPRDYAETASRVRIKAPHWQHTGTGGRFWIAEERFSLLSDTEAIYDQQ